MKLAKRFAALLMGATLAIGSIAGLAACGGNNGDNTGNTGNGGSGTETTVEDQIRAIYDLYAASCAENNTTPQTYEEWLALIKGEQGEQGTPGTNGTNGKSAYELYVEGYKLAHEGSTEGVLDEAAWLASLKGETGEAGETGPTGPQGKSAYDLYVDQYKAEHDGSAEGVLDEAAWLASLKGDRGESGAKGLNGQRGTKWFFGEGGPGTISYNSDIVSGKYIDGDFYLDITEWRVFVLEHTGTKEYKWRELGQIKGVGGGEEAVKYEYEIDLAENANTTISVEGLAAGPHLVLMNTGTVQKKKIASSPVGKKLYQWKIKVEDASYYSLLARNTTRSMDSGYEIAFGFIVVHEGDKTATVQTVNEALKGTLTIEEEVWAPDFSKFDGTVGGGSIEMPVNGYKMPAEDIIKFTYPDNVDGKGFTASTRWTARFIISNNDIDFDGEQITKAAARFYYMNEDIATVVPGWNTKGWFSNSASATVDAFNLTAPGVDLGGKQGYLIQYRDNSTSVVYAEAEDIWPITVIFTTKV